MFISILSDYPCLEVAHGSWAAEAVYSGRVPRRRRRRRRRSSGVAAAASEGARVRRDVWYA